MLQRTGVADQQSTLAEIVEHQPRQRDEEPRVTNWRAAKVTHVGIERFRSCYRKKDCTEYYEGREAMIALHDGLYGEALQVHLRHDIPFEPHITVATLETFEECDGLTHAMNGAFPTIRGVVNVLDVVEIEPTVVRTIRSVPLT